MKPMDLDAVDRSNADVSRLTPFGLTTVISQPARRRERHIDQTRLSAGTLSFSTMISVLSKTGPTGRSSDAWKDDAGAEPESGSTAAGGRVSERRPITTVLSSGRVPRPMPGGRPALRDGG